MSEMLERVARAIREVVNTRYDDREEYCGPEMAEMAARAALEAMREPTQAMRKAGADLVGSYSTWTQESGARETYVAMIDAALKDG